MNRERVIGYVEGSGTMYRISGNELQICCPFCVPPDTRFKFYFNLVKDKGHCFRCDARVGSAERFLVQCCKIPETRIVTQQKEAPVANYLKHIVKRRKKKDMRGEAVLPDKTVSIVERPDLVLSKEVHNYLIDRGFYNSTIKKLDPMISFTYPNWFILPIRIEGKLNFWIRRSLMKHEMSKYISFDYKTDGNGDEDSYFGSSDVLWGYDLIKQGDTIILCEGILSAAAVVQQGLHAVAVLGSTLSKEQRDLLKKKEPKNIVVALDGKNRGDNTYKKSHNMVRQLYDHFDYVDQLILPDGKDPNDLGRDFLKIYEEQLVDH